jgi:fructoselysine transporter
LENQLQRKLGLLQSTALNMIDMVGIGPFICLSFVMSSAGSMYLWAWLFGAFLSLIDATIWSELGTAFPKAGGSYNFLKEAYGKNSVGKMMGFLYVWQTIIQAPLVAASAAIGFSQYLGYLVVLNDMEQKAISGIVILIVTFLLYRKIDGIGKIGIILWACVLVTMGWIIIGGIANGNFLQPIREMNMGFSWNYLFSFMFGQACVKSVYSYLGYYNICHLGAEIKNPNVNIPKSMFISVIGIALLYFCMNVSITSVMPWQEIALLKGTPQENYVVSLFMEKLYGSNSDGTSICVASIVVTILILIVALSSLFAVMLGYSRVPYAAAVDGQFFKIFAKLHPTKNFPYISLLVLAGIAFIFSLLFRMGDVINGILAMRILLQFIGQAFGVVLLRKRFKNKHLVYKMPLFPLPVILVIIMWSFIFYATGLTIIKFFFIVIISGLIVYFIFAKKKNQWPFVKKLNLD